MNRRVFKTSFFTKFGFGKSREVDQASDVSNKSITKASLIKSYYSIIKPPN